MSQRATAHTLEEAVSRLKRGEWERAHELVDDLEDPFAYWAHAIVHLQEGDLGNARYWFARAERPFSSDVAAQLAALVAALEQA